MRTSIKLIALAATLVVVAASQAQTSSRNFRIEGDKFVSTSATTGSSNFTLKLIGGEGSPLGQSNSPTYTASSGPGQTTLPTGSTFNSSFE